LRSPTSWCDTFSESDLAVFALEMFD
jgi:hypothetical protein